jgi:hypothetical protein
MRHKRRDAERAIFLGSYLVLVAPPLGAKSRLTVEICRDARFQYARQLGTWPLLAAELNYPRQVGRRALCEAAPVVLAGPVVTMSLHLSLPRAFTGYLLTNRGLPVSKWLTSQQSNLLLTVAWMVGRQMCNELHAP